MSPQQKISVIALGVFAIAAITLGLLHLHQSIYKPVAWKSPGNIVEQTRERKETAAELDSKDTDNDGLSDYAELVMYGTSPYLSDTDGDNINDRDEIIAGTDPNCPTGDVCEFTPTPEIKSETNIAEGLLRFQDLGTAMPGIDSAATQQLAVIQQLLTGEGISPDMVRELMIQNGAEKEKLDQVSDEDLMDLYMQAVNQMNAGGGTGLGAAISQLQEVQGGETDLGSLLGGGIKPVQE